MHSCHEALDNAKVVMDDFGQGCQTVGGAASIRHNLEVIAICANYSNQLCKLKKIWLRSFKIQCNRNTRVLSMLTDLLGRVVLFVIDSHDVHWCVSGWSGDDDLLSSLEKVVRFRLHSFKKHILLAGNHHVGRDLHSGCVLMPSRWW